MSYSFDFKTLARAYATRDLTPGQLVDELLRCLAARGDDKVWLHRATEAELRQQARDLEARRARGEALPLYGLPFGVKDNIDVAGWPTSAGCAAFAYVPTRSAAVVEKLQAAGALLVGKQNMDQFATGLVGVRTTTGHCANAIDARVVPGGSSSGSAVAVAAGVVSFSIGSDTGGSGRVPGALNNVVGLKPTPGAASTRGFLYCNRSFDVPPVFALTVDDAYAVLQQIVGPDDEDPYTSQHLPTEPTAWQPGALPARWRFAVPAAPHLDFFGDDAQRRAWERTLDVLTALGGEREEIDFAPFLEAGRLVFGGPLIAERWLTYGRTVEQHPGAVHPAVKQALLASRDYSAADTFGALYRLRTLQREVGRRLRDTLLVTPTVGRIPTVAEVDAEPMLANSRMGHYTYFANPLRLAAVSVPAGWRDDGLPFGLQIVGPSFSERPIGALARAVQQRLGGRLGASGHRLGNIPT
ncbi:allophanate hydrolase [Roseateles sp.]|uniref:allophanate hydrolase n=1 Tax=Roseateles sp. TaxID=1971397 RepID=UPI0039EC1B68